MRPTLVLMAAMMVAACMRSREEPADTLAGAAGVKTGDTATVPPPAPPETSAAPPSTGDRPASRPSAGGPPAQPAQRPPGRLPPPASGASSSGSTASDTARGIVAVVGAIPITEVVLRPAGGQQITLTGALAREIGVASGADVWVRGRRAGARTIDVAAYAVRSVDGVTAITGTLTADGDRLVLVTDDGRRHPIARPPEPLRQHVGARIWITGDPSTAISTYGILRRAR
jgi:hypothetical protein